MLRGVMWMTLGAAAGTQLGSLMSLRGGSLQLIDATGAFNKGAAAEAAAGASADLALITSVGAQARGRRLLNDLFGTDFSTDASDGGAWLAASSSAPSVVALATEGSSAEAEMRDGADAGKLTSFSLALADAVLVHTPSTPSGAQIKASYEAIFAQHQAVKDAAPAKVLLVHVGEGEEKAVRSACAEAWEAVAAATGQPGAAFDERFELECVALPHRTIEADAYAAAVQQLGARLKGLAGGGFGKELKAASLPGAAEAAWGAACAALDAQPSEGWMEERHLVEKAYDTAFAMAQEAVAPWASSVAGGKWVRGFGEQAAALLEGALAAYEDGVADVPAGALVAARGSKLRKAVQNDLSNLFAKQHKLLATQQVGRYKSQLLKVVSRSGKLENWQREGLQRQAEKSFDLGLTSIYVPGLLGPSKQQLLDAFSKQLTATATAFQESPTMQLQAIAAMRRRTGKQQKPPRGVRVGLGLVAACHSKLGGGQGNLQTFAGYTAGLNSVHALFANDGGLPDSSGSEPDLLRFQPKLNFDIAI